MKETSIEELCNEYAGAFRVVDNCRQEEKYGKPCLTCLADKERMQEIIKEITTKIEEKQAHDNEILVNTILEDHKKTLNSGRKMYELGKEETYKHYQEEIKKIIAEYKDSHTYLDVDLLQNMHKLIDTN